MNNPVLYSHFFNISKDFNPCVTYDLVESGKISWTNFYPHKTFIELLSTTLRVLNGQELKSLWVEGAYGTGKSYAVLTIKSLIEASEEDTNQYIEKYKLDDKFKEKFSVLKNQSKIIVVHCCGADNITDDKKLILTIQRYISKALTQHGFEKLGQSSLKETVIKWLSEEKNKEWMRKSMEEERYVAKFGGLSIDAVLSRITDPDVAVSNEMLSNLIDVAENDGFGGFAMNAHELANWIKAAVLEAGITMLFIWDEFTSFFQNTPHSLVSFQTIADLSQSVPFYFMVVTHLSQLMITDDPTLMKIRGRFTNPVKIELPDNMAFKLMGSAMKIANEPAISSEWISCRKSLDEKLVHANFYIAENAKIDKDDLSTVVPMHPYAALVLKYISTTYKSNQRSMFDFIISNNEERQGLKWYIKNFSPYDIPISLLTVDMLWNFFYETAKLDLNQDVRSVLCEFDKKKCSENLSNDKQRVLKVELILEAISRGANNVALLLPTDKNIELAFDGVWVMGKAKSILNELYNDKILFEKQKTDTFTEYTVASGILTDCFEKNKPEILSKITTKTLIQEAELIKTINLQGSLKCRFVFKAACAEQIVSIAKNLHDENLAGNQIKCIITFALSVKESSVLSELLFDLMEKFPEIIFINAGKSTMSDDLLDRYVSAKTWSHCLFNSNRNQSNEYEKNAKDILTDWTELISSQPFEIFYKKFDFQGKFIANASAVLEKLKELNGRLYPYAPDHFKLIDNMFVLSQASTGAECGLTGIIKGQYKSPIKHTSIENALAGAWNVPNYWTDSTKQSLPIVKMKIDLDNFINDQLSSASSRVSIFDIYDHMAETPFGFTPCNISAFLLGFLLKEYVQAAEYFLTDGKVSNSLETENLKIAVANTIAFKAGNPGKFKEEYISRMSREHRAFLKSTSLIFQIEENECSTIEYAACNIRSKMQKFYFPIWSTLYLLDSLQLQSSTKEINSALDFYSNIVNSGLPAKSGETESLFAAQLGSLFLKNEKLTNDLATLLTSENTKSGMEIYLHQYDNGKLLTLAEKINDGGRYIEQLKSKFSKDSNWLWKKETADSVLQDVITEYEIIEGTNTIFGVVAGNYKDCIAEWKTKLTNIKISYEALKTEVSASYAYLLEELKTIAQRGLAENQKSNFLTKLTEQGDAFFQFYKDQQSVFKKIFKNYTEDLSDEDVNTIFSQLPSGQFLKPKGEYMSSVNEEIKKFKKNQRKNIMLSLWKEKTGTKNPLEWSERYAVPIACMLDKQNVDQIKEYLDIINQISPSEADVENTLDWLNKTDLSFLNDPDNRDDSFMKNFVEDYNILLNDIAEIRTELRKEGIPVYQWFWNNNIKNRLKILAEKEYDMHGADKAMNIISRMDTETLRKYLRELLLNNVKVGMEILKNSTK